MWHITFISSLRLYGVSYRPPSECSLYCIHSEDLHRTILQHITNPCSVCRMVASILYFYRWFQHLAAYCEKYNNLIPVAFILGFYVSVVVSRFWQQLNSLPWPNSMAVFVSAMIHGIDAEGRKIRRTIMRYLTLTYILTMRDISPPVRRRFPELKYITNMGNGVSELNLLLKVQKYFTTYFLVTELVYSLLRLAVVSCTTFCILWLSFRFCVKTKF